MAAPMTTRPPPPKRERRLTLAQGTRGVQQDPDWILIYGVEKIGKSTFAAQAPGACFVRTEDRHAHIDAFKLPLVTHWLDVFDLIDELRTTQHEHKTLVIDTVDALEPFCWAYCCERDGQKTIDARDNPKGPYGWGKGYDAALDEWRRLVFEMQRLRRERGMGIVLIGHALVKPFKNPEGDDYERYTLRLHQKAAGLLKDTAETILFANYETFTAEIDGRSKGVGGQQRFLYTTRTAAYDAGNSHDLPPKIPMTHAGAYADYAGAKAAGASRLRAEVERLITAASEKDAAAARSALARADSATKLAQLAEWLKTRPATTNDEPTAA